MNGHVFMSHGSENRDEADALSALLEARGIKTWIAPRDVRPGRDYSEQLQEAIEACVAFVVLVTDMANKSPYVRAETEMAFSTSKPIFPVRQSDVKPASGLALFLKIRHWTDAYGKDADAAMSRLVLELQTLSGVAADEAGAAAASRPPAPPPLPQADAAAPVATPGLSADEERLAAAIGPNAAFYIERWRQMDAKGSIISWNWAACLANLFWFPYRKMWVHLVAFIAIMLLLEAVGSISPVMAKGELLLLIGLTFLTGFYGNHLYRGQIKKLIAETAGLDQPNALAMLRARGGISTVALAISLAIGALLTLAILVGLQRNFASQRGGGQPIAGQAQPAQPPPQPVQADAAGAADDGGITLDRDFLVGRWTDSGDCSRASVLNPDGTFIAADGSSGLWNLAGDRLTFAGDSTLTVRIEAVDANTLAIVNPDGSLARAIRC